MTHTYVVLKVSRATFDEIFKKLADAAYDHVFHRDPDSEDMVIDMHGIALQAEGE